MVPFNIHSKTHLKPGLKLLWYNYENIRITSRAVTFCLVSQNGKQTICLRTISTATRNDCFNIILFITDPLPNKAACWHYRSVYLLITFTLPFALLFPFVTLPPPLFVLRRGRQGHREPTSDDWSRTADRLSSFTMGRQPDGSKPQNKVKLDFHFLGSLNFSIFGLNFQIGFQPIFTVFWVFLF